MRNEFGAPGRGHPSSPRSRSERQVAHGHPSRSSISPIRATWRSANRIVTPSSRLTSRSTGSLLSSTAPGCLIPVQTTRTGRSVHEAGPSSLRSSGGAGGASACGSCTDGPSAANIQPRPPLGSHVARFGRAARDGGAPVHVCMSAKTRRTASTSCMGRRDHSDELRVPAGPLPQRTIRTTALPSAGVSTERRFRGAPRSAERDDHRAMLGQRPSKSSISGATEAGAAPTREDRATGPSAFATTSDVVGNAVDHCGA